MRTSTWIFWRPPMRSTIWSCRKRSSLTCSGCGRSPISSRNSVPLWALSILPMVCFTAPVKAPRSWPNSSLSSRFSGIAPQLMATNGCLARGPRSCSALRQRLLAGAAFAQQQHRNVGRWRASRRRGRPSASTGLAVMMLLDRRRRRRGAEPAVLLLQPMQVAGRARRSCAAYRVRPAFRRNRRRPSPPPSARSCARHCR